MQGLSFWSFLGRMDTLLCISYISVGFSRGSELSTQIVVTTVLV